MNVEINAVLISTDIEKEVSTIACTVHTSALWLVLYNGQILHTTHIKARISHVRL